MINYVKNQCKLTLKAANIPTLHELPAQAVFVDVIPSAHDHVSLFLTIRTETTYKRPTGSQFVGRWQCSSCHYLH